MLTTHLDVVPRLMSRAMSMLSLYAFMPGAGTALSFLLIFLFSTYFRQLEQEILGAGTQNADDICT
jgi:cell division protein FtsW (lipid II flippase)